jgi:sortase A
MRLLRKSLIGCQYALLTVSLAAWGYCAVVVAEAALYQSWAQGQIKERSPELSTNSRSGPATSANSVAALQGQPARRPGEMSVLGRLEVPRIGLSAMIAEGTSGRVLRRAVGHLPDTALPGQTGNVVLAGHRDTFFRELGRVKTGDVIRITTRWGPYAYVVRFTEVVAPDETWVLEPASGQTLTLVTCYPFHYIGAAPKRFVVRARRVSGPTPAGDA